MDCEFSVELGVDDPTLSVPWRSPDGTIAYVDLRAEPGKIERLAEVRKFPELGEFLRAMNLSGSEFQTAKCDAWFDTLMDVDDEPYEATMKCASYVDIFFSGEGQLSGFAEQERLAREVVRRLRAAENLPARVEVVLRRAFFEEHEGFYWTIYATGYGSDLATSRKQWARSLRVLEHCLLSA